MKETYSKCLRYLDDIQSNKTSKYDCPIIKDNGKPISREKLLNSKINIDRLKEEINLRFNNITKIFNYASMSDENLKHFQREYKEELRQLNEDLFLN